MSLGVSLFYIALIVVMIVGMWKLFTKAGRPGWASIVPIYNTYLLCKIAGRPGWWLVLMFLPLVNIAVLLILSLDLAKAFGRSAAFGVIALWIFPYIGYLMLGFGKDTYHDPSAAIAPTSEPAAPAAV